ncbi:DUF2947 family protein [Thalassotalea profundi]|uniref:DUF2947 family protein n=1 Tax=Thalassotalea profundi TaxID=2036687 RepID=A0ABQ3IGX6_9GAMM|nr:DUF2947 family protein [Thalassotalea profundi]GHE83353.1 hypothetical protein GCM10011501_09760 [Thalassotalea profundi]
MNYIELNDFKYAWIFRHQSMPLEDKFKKLIKPLAQKRANNVWDESISKQVDHPDFFKKGDWPANKAAWIDNGEWESTWESDAPDLPESISDYLNWDNNTTVYYCINRNLIIETTWINFKRCWKNFLFLDDGTILLGKKRQQAVQFTSDGMFKLGNKNKK